MSDRPDGEPKIFYVGRIVAVYDDAAKVLRTQTAGRRLRRWTETITYDRLPANVCMGMRLSARIDLRAHELADRCITLFESPETVVRTTEGAQCAVS